MFLFSGGVSESMYGKLPIEITSVHGFSGCLGSFDLNGEAVDPINNALVPSTLVTDGCKGESRVLIMVVY
jgi:neurexin